MKRASLLGPAWSYDAYEARLPARPSKDVVLQVLAANLLLSTTLRGPMRAGTRYDARKLIPLHLSRTTEIEN